MGDENQTSITALDFALQTERDGEEFYSRVATETHNPLVRATFVALARDEQYHIRAIEKFAAKLKVDGVWEDAELSARVSDLSGEIVTMFREALETDTLTGESSHDSDAYKSAAEFEAKGGAFYAQQAASAQDTAAKRFWTFLAEEEARHLHLLQETLNYLDNPGDWYLIGERGMIDGG